MKLKTMVKYGLLGCGVLFTYGLAANHFRAIPIVKKSIAGYDH